MPRLKCKLRHKHQRKEASLMKKHTISLQLIQRFLTDDELKDILQEFNVQEKARKCTVRVLLSYLIHAAANEWKSLRHSADVGASVGLISIEHSSLSKHMKALDKAIMKCIFTVIVNKLNRSARRSMKLPKKQLLLIDSTTVTVGKTRLPWAIYHGEKSGIKLHVSYTHTTGMPLKVVETTGRKNDGPIGIQLEAPRFIIVGDRAYFSIDKVDRYLGSGQDFVFRLKENILLNRKKSLQRNCLNGSNVATDFTCILGSSQKQTEKRHRVVEFLDDDGDLIRVVTSLMDVSAEEIADIYKSRWAIESFFRWIKQNLNVPVLFGTTENAVFNQLFAALIAYVILKWLHVHSQKQPYCKRLSFAGFLRMLLCDTLQVEWKIALREITSNRLIVYETSG